MIEQQLASGKINPPGTDRRRGTGGFFNYTQKNAIIEETEAGVFLHR